MSAYLTFLAEKTGKIALLGPNIVTFPIQTPKIVSSYGVY
jgi:hypothetical protein